MKSVNKTKKLALALLLFGMLALTPVLRAAEIWTDQEDYAPWEIVTITGAGFEPSTEDVVVDVNVTITWPDGYVDGPYSGTTNDLGNFLFIYGKDKFEGTYTVVVEDSAGNTAKTTFTDSVTSLTITSPITSSPVSVLPGGMVNVTYTITVDNLSEQVDTKVHIPGVGTANPALFTPTTLTFTKTTTVNVSPTALPGWYNVTVTANQPKKTGSGSWQQEVTQSNAVEVISPTPSDTTPPIITPNVVGTLGSNGWYVSDVTVSWNISDPESAVTSIVYNTPLPHTITEDTAGTIFTCTATSAGGTNSVSVTIKRDATPTVVIINAPVNGAYYKTEDVPTGDYTIVEENLCTVDEDGWSDEEGVHTYTVTATDDAGNVGSASVTYTVDNTPPVVTINAPADGAYHKSSNLPALDYSVVELNPYTVVEEGYSADEGEHTVIVTATDAAGNVGSDSVTYIVDDTPPEITIITPADGVVYILNQVVLADWEAIDELSGIATVTATADDGDPSDTSTLGEKSFTVTATDNAGNTDSLTVHYNVQYDFGGFLPPVSLDGRSLFKLGSTIPVKFQLFDAARDPASTAVATIRVVKISSGSPVGMEVDGVSTSAATTGNLFRYDTTGQLYIFNLATKSLPAPADGTWRITVYLNDGTSQSIDIGIKK